jgi:hypothetical protein
VLVEGQPLIVPAGVQSNANNAATFQPVRATAVGFSA